MTGCACGGHYPAKTHNKSAAGLTGGQQLAIFIQRFFPAPTHPSIIPPLLNTLASRSPHMLQIGPYKLPNRVALAPMAGVTDLPFRRLCAQMGAGLVVAEMISSNPLLRDSRKTLLRSRHDGEIQPRSVQIAGNDPATMAAAAVFNVAEGAQIIDINMGCPAKKVCRRAAGSALLVNEPLVRDILTAVVKAVDVPVTLKIRTGPALPSRTV